MNSYARCEGSIDELLYYFITRSHCSCKGEIKLLKPTLQLKLLEYLVHYYSLDVQQRDCTIRHHDLTSGEDIDKAIYVSPRFGLDIAPGSCKVTLSPEQRYDQSSRGLPPQASS